MPSDVVGVLLAGGQSRRMGGGDKCLKTVGGETLLSRVIARARPQVGPLLLNANGDPTRFSGFGLPVVADVVEGFHGPLAGVLTGMDWAADQVPATRWIATFATDAPFFPLDLVDRLLAAVEEAAAELACAKSAGRTHPVFGLWPVALAGDLRSTLVDEQLRRIDAWTARHRLVEVSFPTEPFDPFFNLNSPEDLAAAACLARSNSETKKQ